MLRLLVFTLLALAPSAHGQSTVDMVRTAGMSNGRFWASMDVDIKVMYLTGIKDILIATKPPEEGQYLPGLYSTGEIAKSIDQFYETPENTLIPIVYALRVSVMKFKGATPAQIETVVAGLRRAIVENPLQPRNDR